MDFMRKLLVKDPNMRMSTAQALRHPFITGQVPRSAQMRAGRYTEREREIERET